MYTFEVTYVIVINDKEVKAETIGISHKETRTSEDFENYIRALLEPFQEIRITKVREISLDEWELKFGEK